MFHHCSPYEYLWRIIGTENSLYWMMEEPEAYRAFVDRIGAFLLDFAKAQIKEGKGRLSGMYIWDDVAYRNGMLFNPNTWREIFKPHVKALIDLCHSHGLMTVYHGCGNAAPIYDDMVEIGLDGYNPLEVKAGLDVVELKKKYAGKLAFVGNIDVQVLERGDRNEIKKQVLYKLQVHKQAFEFIRSFLIWSLECVRINIHCSRGIGMSHCKEKERRGSAVYKPYSKIWPALNKNWQAAAEFVSYN